MTGWELVLRGLRLRWVASVLNTLGVAVGVGAVCVVLVIQADVQRRFEGPARSYGLVVGAPGSAQQLVLNSVFHLDESPGILPLSVWRELDAHESTALVVPYAVGDSFRGFRVVATTDAFFDPRFPDPAGERPGDKLRDGRPLQTRESAVREAVVGADVADAIGLRVDDRIELSHGVEDGAAAHDREVMWEVVGVLEPTGTALDRVVLIDLHAFLAMDEHARAQPGLSALLVFPHRGVHTAVLMGELRPRSDLQVAHVGTEVRRLLALVGRVDTLFLIVSQLIVVVALSSVFASAYVAAHARRGQIGILRALGLPRRSIVALVVAESSVLAFAGAVLGLLGAHLLLYLGADAIETAAGLRFEAGHFVGGEAIVVVAVVLAGALAGVLPGVQAYRADVVACLRAVE